MDDVLGYEGAAVVVTGAASGMGAAAAQILVDLGAEVTAIDIKPTDVPVARSLEVDLRDRAAIARPEEQAWPLVMLGSPRCSYVVGEVFAGDGGFQGARYTGRHQAGWADLIEGE